MGSKNYRHDAVHHQGRFLTGATDFPVEAMIAKAQEVKFPVVYFSDDEDHDKLTPFQLACLKFFFTFSCFLTAFS